MRGKIVKSTELFITITADTCRLNINKCLARLRFFFFLLENYTRLRDSQIRKRGNFFPFFFLMKTRPRKSPFLF